MKLKRRQFLFLASLSGIGASCSKKIIGNQLSKQSELNSAINSYIALEQLAPTQPILRFISVADTGTGAQEQYAVAEAMTRHHRQNSFDLAILAGDNIYNDGEIEKIGAVFERPYQALLQQGVKFRACLGNHDIRTANGEPQIRYAGFNMPGRYYTFRRDKVQFFVLDTNTNANWKTQLPWLEQQLSSSDAPWKIVVGHHPIYSSGHYGTNQAFIKSLTPLFQKYKVQLYINGHDHHYERTRSINNTTYLVCGAGAGVRPVGRSAWTESAESRLSFAAFKVYPDKIEISGIDTKNRIFDQGVIQLQTT